MAAPTFVGASDVWAQGTGDITVVWPIGHQADDIGVLFVQTCAQTPATPAGWTLFQGATTGTAGVAGSTGLHVLEARGERGRGRRHRLRQRRPQPGPDPRVAGL
jgi:hypothetical protein